MNPADVKETIPIAEPVVSAGPTLKPAQATTLRKKSKKQQPYASELRAMADKLQESPVPSAIEDAAFYPWTPNTSNGVLLQKMKIKDQKAAKAYQLDVLHALLQKDQDYKVKLGSLHKVVQLFTPEFARLKKLVAAKSIGKRTDRLLLGAKFVSPSKFLGRLRNLSKARVKLFEHAGLIDANSLYVADGRILKKDVPEKPKLIAWKSTARDAGMSEEAAQEFFKFQAIESSHGIILNFRFCGEGARLTDYPRIIDDDPTDVKLQVRLRIRHDAGFCILNDPLPDIEGVLTLSLGKLPIDIKRASESPQLIRYGCVSFDDKKAWGFGICLPAWLKPERVSKTLTQYADPVLTIAEYDIDDESNKRKSTDKHADAHKKRKKDEVVISAAIAPPRKPRPPSVTLTGHK